MTTHILYGSPHSLYTGKARCYLRKQGIAYRELPTSHPTFASDVVPKIGRGIIPVLITPEGKIIQDTIDIIDHFETQGVPYPAYPSTPLQRVLSILIEYYGSQSMLRHAMHYRWSYLDQQSRFLRDAFASGSGAASSEKVMQRMQSYLPQLGVSTESIPLIERSFESLLDVLNEHFTHHPYLLGGVPTIADYGLIGPMFAHLGRDPVPAHIMKTRAPKVFRWVERMTAPDLDAPEFHHHSVALSSDDSVPSTLEPLLTHMAEEIFPELTDKMDLLDRWISERQPRDGDPVSEKPHQRRLGMVTTTFRGVRIESGVEPYLVYVLRRADRALASAGNDDRTRVQDYLQRFGLQRALIGERGYSVDRRNHIEVWAR